MKFLHYLNEEYFGTVRSCSGASYEVFLNPDKKEFAEIPSKPYCRFVLDVEKEDLYVWDMNCLHADVCVDLKNVYKLEGITYPYAEQYIWGTGKLMGGKIDIMDLYISSRTDNILHKKGLIWTKYFFGDSFIKYMKKHYPSLFEYAV